MGRSAPLEGSDETPIVGAASAEDELAPGTVVPKLAIVCREDS